MSKTPFEIYTGDLTDGALEDVMDWYGVRDANDLPKPLAMLIQGDDWVEEPSPALKAKKNPSVFYAAPTQVKFLCPTLNWRGYVYHNGIAFEDRIIDLSSGMAYPIDEIFEKFPDVPHDKLIGGLYTHWKEIPENVL